MGGDSPAGQPHLGATTLPSTGQVALIVLLAPSDAAAEIARVSNGLQEVCLNQADVVQLGGGGRAETAASSPCEHLPGKRRESQNSEAVDATEEQQKNKLPASPPLSSFTLGSNMSPLVRWRGVGPQGNPEAPSLQKPDSLDATKLEMVQPKERETD